MKNKKKFAWYCQRQAFLALPGYIGFTKLHQLYQATSALPGYIGLTRLHFNQADNTTQYNLRAPFKDNSLHIALYYHLTKNKSPIINQVSLQTH